MTKKDRITSRIVDTYRGRLTSWAEALQNEIGTIVAISRKGPRLLELLIREGLLPPSFPERVVTEHALPFLRNISGDLVIIDDAINFGSTLSKILDVSRSAYLRCGGAGQVKALPFAVSAEASEDYLSLVSKFFLRLESGRTAAFMNNLTSGLRLLGKPFDVDHPMLSITGDFGDFYRLQSTMEQVSWRMKGRLISIDTDVPTSEGLTKVRSWTLLLDPCPNRLAGTGVCKLRAFLNQESTEITVAAMSPFTINRNDLENLIAVLPQPLRHLWNEVQSSIDAKPDCALATASHRSLAMWASFLASALLLRSSREIFLEEFGANNYEVDCLGPREDDLRLLLGPELAKRAEFDLNDYLVLPEAPVPLTTEVQPSLTEVVVEVVPEKYKEEYQRQRASFFGSLPDVHDVLSAVFYAQHRAIELPSRVFENGNQRLDFGITYGYLKQIVQQAVPDAEDVVLHRCLDRLIDDGCIVPRLLNIGSATVPEWIHVFRVGEGPIPKAVHTIRLLFEALSKEYRSNQLPRLLFEKFCVLALAVASDNKDLVPLRMNELRKGFHLYGARVMLNTGQREEFLLDWAVDHGILFRVSDHPELNERSGKFSLNGNLEDTYPHNEIPWDAEVQDAVEDLALLVKTVHKAKDLKDSALIALTSLASNQELHRAVEAELDLWLHHRRFSIYDSLTAMAKLARHADERALNDKELNEANHQLFHTANFTAQVNEKVGLASRRDSIYSQIDSLVAHETRIQRNWRKLRTTLDGRLKSEEVGSGCRETLSALRIAYRTNRVLRDLLTLAGYHDPKHRSKPMSQSLELLRQVLKDPDQVDRATRTMFAAKDGHLDVDDMLASVLSQPSNTFSESFRALRPVILEIANRCEEVLRHFGSGEFLERKQTLEPPQYIVMWDIRGSTNIASRDEIEPLIGAVNRRILVTLGSRAMDFKPDSKDDGNGLICNSISDVLTVFQILTEVLRDHPFRAGCEVNLQGRLDYYPSSKALGGRAFEHAARVAAMFKEVRDSRERWEGGDVPTEPDSSYLLVGEFARRYAIKEQTWPPDYFDVTEFDGRYEPRVVSGLPIKVTMILPRT
jgi:hypothetical protein